MGSGFGNHCYEGAGHNSQHCGSGGGRYGNSFALIVVLFILLVIVGTAFYC